MLKIYFLLSFANKFVLNSGTKLLLKIKFMFSNLFRCVVT